MVAILPPTLVSGIIEPLHVAVSLQECPSNSPRKILELCERGIYERVRIISCYVLEIGK